jgi:hypothetical protein
MAAKGVGSLLLLLFLLPLLYLAYRLLRIRFASGPNKKADQVYRAALYRFHIAGVERENETPLDYAHTKIDPTFNAGFEEFMRMYLRLKYANGNLRDGDTEIIDRFAKQVGPSIRKKNGFFRSTINYFNLLLASRYFQQPENTNYEPTSL